MEDNNFFMDQYINCRHSGLAEHLKVQFVLRFQLYSLGLGGYSLDVMLHFSRSIQSQRGYYFPRIFELFVSFEPRVHSGLNANR